MAKAEGGRQARRERLARSAQYAGLEKEILGLFSQNFESDVSGVYIAEGVGSEGEAILRVMVVLGTVKTNPSGRELLGLVRNIRSCIGEAAPFPVVSFVSKSDAERLKVEAA